MSRPALALILVGALALAGGISAAEPAAPEAEEPQLANLGETAIAFAFLTGPAWTAGQDLLDETEMLATGAMLPLDLPRRTRGEAMLRLVSADGFVTDVGRIAVRDLRTVAFDDGKVTLIYDDGTERIPMQTTSYLGGIDCLDEGVKDAECLAEMAEQRSRGHWPILAPSYW